VEASTSGQLEIVTAAFRRASDFKDVRYPPVLFDTKTRRFSPAGEPALIVRKPPAPPQPKMERAMPWLGGPVLADVTVGGKHVLCGTRGAVVLAGSETAKVAAVFDVRETGSLLDQRAAERLPLFRFTPEALAPLLRDTNPFVRMKALDTIARVQGNAAWVGILGSTIHDAFLPVRRLAVRAVANAGLADWRSFLEQGLSDADGQVQDSCAYGLAKLGTLVPLHYYESMLRRNEPYNPNSIPPIFDELAKQPTPEVMALLLRQRIGAYTDRVHDAGAGRIGSAVAGYPASVDLLLRSYRPGEVHWSQPTFPQAVLAAAGTAIRPQLLDALRTPDRVARSNAARALGLMGDRTAIPALLAALDLESGLSRVSIVWALGKLHASEAVPALSALYLAVAPRSDSMRGRAYMGQMTQGIVWGYGQFETVEALKANWDALKTAKTPEAPKGQFSGEDMLTTEQILAALKDIGGPSTRNFYRGLAASKDASVRYQAAVGLADAGPDNVDVLRGLMGDDDANTSSAAAVSLFLLGDEAGQPEVQRRMEQCDPSGTLLHELYRVTDVKRLAFLKAAAESCDVRGAVGFSGQYSVDRILGRPHR
jgi:HEAT repeat protein